MSEIFARFLDAWSLTPDGEIIATHSSRLLPVRRGRKRLMLKVAMMPEERLGGDVLRNWQSGPFVAVSEAEGDAILMDRAEASPDLRKLAASDDGAATDILCEVLNEIHKSSPTEVVLQPLADRFSALWSAPDDAALSPARTIARELLDTPEAATPLHGDMHHGNVLWFGKKGWQAIDPKGVLGERGFDYANLFCNPSVDVALAPGVFEARVARVVARSSLSRQRLLKWIIAYTGLSAAWSISSADDPKPALEIGDRALSILRE